MTDEEIIEILKQGVLTGRLVAQSRLLGQDDDWSAHLAEWLQQDSQQFRTIPKAALADFLQRHPSVVHRKTSN